MSSPWTSSFACAHRVLLAGPVSPSNTSRLRACSDCGSPRVVCAFCSASVPPGEHVREWRVFGLNREQQPKSFPIDFRDLKGEQLEWLCCPECFAESGEPAMMRYLNGRGSMVPAPNYHFVYRYEDFRRVAVEEQP